MFGLSAAHCVVNMSVQETSECRDLGFRRQYPEFEQIHQRFTVAKEWEVFDHKKGTVFSELTSHNHRKGKDFGELTRHA